MGTGILFVSSERLPKSEKLSFVFDDGVVFVVPSVASDGIIGVGWISMVLVSREELGTTSHTGTHSGTPSIGEAAGSETSIGFRGVIGASDATGVTS